jgi:hypothetical protein
MIDNIIAMPTPMNVLADRIRGALARAERGRIDWIEGTLELAVTLKEARERFQSNEAFAHWLVDNRLDYEIIGHHTRGALISMAADLTLARIVLQETQRNSWRYIWEEEMKPRLAYVGKTISQSAPESEPPSESVAAPESDELVSESRANEVPAEPTPPPKITSRSMLSHVPRGAELAAVFQHEKARTLLGNLYKQRGGQSIIQLVFQALDAGLILPNELAPHVPTLTLLFPQAAQSPSLARQYRLDNQADRKHVRDVVLPAMIACRDQLLAAPERAREILAEHEAQLKAKVRTEADQKRREQAITQMQPREQELVMFGQTVWPRVDERQAPYDYDQVRAAIWAFRDLYSWNRQVTQDNSPGSIGIRIRLSTKWYGEYLLRTDRTRENPLRRIFSLVHWFSKLMEQNPQAECKWPGYPTAEAEW